MRESRDEFVSNIFFSLPPSPVYETWQQTVVPSNAYLV